MSIDQPVNPSDPMTAPGPEPTSPNVAPGQPQEPIITDVPIPPGGPEPLTPPSQPTDPSEPPDYGPAAQP